MMALATHQLQGSCSTFPLVPSSWSRGSKLKYPVPRFHAVGREDGVVSLKCRLCSSVGTSLVLGSKSKVFKISAFKRSSQYDDSGVEANGSKSLKNAVKVSYFENKSEGSIVESSKVHKAGPAPWTAAGETATRSLAIQNIFKNWLMLLRAPSQGQAAEEIIEESYSTETSERPNASQTQERGDILKAVSCYYLGLDATIKIPLLLFTSTYLAVNLIYGSKVSKDLFPLWILGPLFLAFFVKTFRAICGLYAFSFEQTAQVIKHLPVHYSQVHNYIVHRKLNEAMRTHIVEPLAHIKNMNYNEVGKRITKDLQRGLGERYLDFIESVWPYYCRTIRFLKTANLV